jgi:hypothetical protein
MARAATDFFGSLSPDNKSKALEALDSPQRSAWNYLPHGSGQPAGISTGELSAKQRELGMRLVRTGMSAIGAKKAGQIVALDNHLHEITGRDYSSGHYWYTLFGEPGIDAPWGWRFEGHHLSLNFTVTPVGISTTPMFMGANPAHVESGPDRGLRVLGREYDLAAKLMSSLNSIQLERAVISGKTYGDIVFGMGDEERPFGADGIPASALSEAQRELLGELISTYTGNLNPHADDHYLEQFHLDRPEQVHFAWAGETATGRPCYYRVTTPELVIEFDNSQQSAAGDGYNHYHTVLREPGNDFGRDFLRRHYEQSPEHRK